MAPFIFFIFNEFRKKKYAVVTLKNGKISETFFF